jgi:hypothetical protein
MRNGFSLLEVLVSISITMVLGAAMFQMSQQNEWVFHDQYLVTEMQQGARAAMAQSADEIRMAGQGVPVYAETFDSAPSEGAVAILSGSNDTRINFRTSIAPADTIAIAPTPLAFTVGMPVSFTVDSASGLYNAVGSSPTGRFLFIWGDLGTSRWGWVRASIDLVTPSMQNVSVTTTEAGPAGVIQFPTFPAVALEEAIAIYFDSATNTVRRTTATSMANPTNPLWAAANDLVSDATLLHFDYFDRSGNSITPTTLTDRARGARVDIRLIVQTAEALSNHTRPTYATTVRTNIRSAMIH